MDFVLISGKNLSLNLRGKIFNRLLPSFLRHYKDKRPPPATAEMLNGSISVWLSHSVIIPFNMNWR